MVVVVDDNRDITESIAMAVDLLGYRAETAEAGDRALPLIVENEPVVVIIDLCLPGITGWELARQIRAHSFSRPPRLVSITGLAEPVMEARAKAAGFDLHLLKPIGLADLRRALT